MSSSGRGSAPAPSPGPEITLPRAPWPSDGSGCCKISFLHRTTSRECGRLRHRAFGLRAALKTRSLHVVLRVAALQGQPATGSGGDALRAEHFAEGDLPRWRDRSDPPEAPRDGGLERGTSGSLPGGTSLRTRPL